jgi:hypothetical protein
MKRTIAFSFTLLVASTAHAQETTHGGLPTDDLAGPRRDDLVDPQHTRSWREGPARAFVSTTIDAGYLYLRPRVSVGYGRPFTEWIGLDANPLIVSAGYGAYGGARFALPFVDLRVGARYFGAFQHSFLDPQDHYSRLDLDSTVRSSARYVTLEAELTAQIPAGPGDILLLGSASDVQGVPDNAYVFEETLHIITAPPFVWRVRGGYALRFGSRGQHSIGLVADVLDVPKRDDSLTIRAGPVLRLVLSRHFDIRGSFVFTLVSPDRLGLVGGDFTELGVRWRTATEP